jgi:hypothetical protein
VSRCDYDCPFIKARTVANNEQTRKREQIPILDSDTLAASLLRLETFYPRSAASSAKLPVTLGTIRPAPNFTTLSFPTRVSSGLVS